MCGEKRSVCLSVCWRGCVLTIPVSGNIRSVGSCDLGPLTPNNSCQRGWCFTNKFYLYILTIVGALQMKAVMGSQKKDNEDLEKAGKVSMDRHALGINSVEQPTLQIPF